MATLEISVTEPHTKQFKVKETFELADELAQGFIDRLEDILADFDRPLKVTKTITGSGRLIVAIEAGIHKPAPVKPTFEERYRRPPLALPAQVGEG